MQTPKDKDRLEAADREIRDTLRRARERQGHRQTVTDEGILAAVQALLDHAGDE